LLIQFLCVSPSWSERPNQEAHGGRQVFIGTDWDMRTPLCTMSMQDNRRVAGTRADTWKLVNGPWHNQQGSDAMFPTSPPNGDRNSIREGR